MQELKTTAEGQIPSDEKHYHIVYINTETGVGAMSPGPDGHVHELIYDPAREPVEPTEAVPPQIDPMTGMPVVDPMTGQPDMGQPATPGDPGKEEGTWIVTPAMDGHDHVIVDYKVKPAEKTEKEKEIIDDCMALWREGVEIVEDCAKKGREAEDFFKGKQWDEDVERGLNALDRAALTINEIAPNIDTLIGYQMEQRTDIKYLPQENGDQRVADMLNVIVKKILDNCYFQREETKVFKDQCLSGKGVFNVDMSFTDNIQGVIKVERFPWDDIVYGPHEKEDLSDCEFEVRSRMVSIAKLKQMFGKKAKEIEKNYSEYKGQFPVVKDNGVNGTHTDYRSAEKIDDMPFTLNGTIPLVDVQKKQFRLVQCTRKTYKEVTVLFHQEENFFFTAYDWKPEDIEAASTLPGFQYVSQVKPRMRITKFCGNLVLSDENPADLPMHDFYTVPAYGYRQDGEFWGKVEGAKDPQRELNKRRSQAMDTMNRLGASVYYIEPETFTDAQEKERFKKKRSKPGSIFEVTDSNRRPVLEAGAELPVSLVNMMQLDQQNLQRLMNVVVEQGGANESGTMFMEKKKGRLTGNQFLFDNLSFAKQKLGKIIVALLQRYYPPERLQKLLNSQYVRQKFKVGDKDFAEYSKEEITEMLSGANLLEYDVIVSESSFSASTRLGIAKTLFELMSQGADIPPELALEFLDVPADIKVNITERLQAQSDQSAQVAADTSNAEITKTLIAKGEYTVAPERAQELGLVPAGGNIASTAPAEPANNETDTIQADIYANNLASSLAG